EADHGLALDGLPSALEDQRERLDRRAEGAVESGRVGALERAYVDRWGLADRGARDARARDRAGPSVARAARDRQAAADAGDGELAHLVASALDLTIGLGAALRLGRRDHRDGPALADRLRLGCRHLGGGLVLRLGRRLGLREGRHLYELN